MPDTSFAPLSLKFVTKYMRLARQVGEDQNACYSRHLGAILVKVYEDGASRIIGSGYNGPPRKTPHCDESQYLQEIVWPQLTDSEKEPFLKTLSPITSPALAFADKYAGCGTCPRRLIGAKSGQRTELCSCTHCETNAIYNAAEDTHGAWLFGWHGLCCWDCSKAVINAGIKRIFVLDDESYAANGGKDYSFGARRLLEWAGVSIFQAKREFYLGDA